MKKKTNPGPSPSGNHYVNLFQNCPRKFYLRYVLGFAPRFSSPPLLNGSAFHHGKAVFYESGSRGKAMTAALSFISSSRKSYESEEELSLARTRIPAMLSAWIERFGLRDLEHYRILEVEREHEIHLYGNFLFTVRLDALVRDREGNLIILETKTSSWRPELTEVELNNGEQATAYIAAVAAIHKKPLSRIFLLPDIVSWPKGSISIAKLSCYRGELIQRDERAIEQWRLGISNLLAEIAQKVTALRSHSCYALFPRNTSWCTSFARPCEYIHVCRRELEPGVVPTGFTRDPDLPDLGATR